VSAQGPDRDLDLLMRTLDEWGVTIRTEQCDGEGGLVRIKDRHILFLPINGSAQQKKQICLAAIGKLMHQNAHVAPRIRKLLGEEEWSE
jgi:hypothetical protein